MTEINIAKKGENYYIRAEGHSGYAGEGSDIVCAAVSTLILSAAAVLTNTKGIRLSRAVVKKGFSELEFSGGEKAEGIYLMLLHGFRGLGATYPEYISCG